MYTVGSKVLAKQRDVYLIVTIAKETDAYWETEGGTKITKDVNHPHRQDWYHVKLYWEATHTDIVNVGNIKSMMAMQYRLEQLSINPTAEDLDRIISIASELKHLKKIKEQYEKEVSEMREQIGKERECECV